MENKSKLKPGDRFNITKSQVRRKEEDMMVIEALRDGIVHAVEESAKENVPQNQKDDKQEKI